MRKRVVAANWKMNGDGAFVADYAARFAPRDAKRTAIVIFPPSLWIGELVGAMSGSGVAVGAQNAYCEAAGAFTGELAPEMVADVGATYVLVGHSERRTLFGEDDQLVANKVAACLRAGLTPMLCVGETLDERVAGHAESVVERQLAAVAEVCGTAGVARSVVAYEPVWAIGTGETATPEQAQAMHAFIRSVLDALGENLGQSVSVLYGGSVKADNAAGLFGQDDIDGALVGGASLDPLTFAEICEASG